MPKHEHDDPNLEHLYAHERIPPILILGVLGLMSLMCGTCANLTPNDHAVIWATLSALGLIMTVPAGTYAYNRLYRSARSQRDEWMTPD